MISILVKNNNFPTPRKAAVSPIIQSKLGKATKNRCDHDNQYACACLFLLQHEKFDIFCTGKTCMNELRCLVQIWYCHGNFMRSTQKQSSLTSSDAVEWFLSKTLFKNITTTHFICHAGFHCAHCRKKYHNMVCWLAQSAVNFHTINHSLFAMIVQFIIDAHQRLCTCLCHTT